jgi:hypothetical protein
MEQQMLTSRPPLLRSLLAAIGLASLAPAQPAPSGNLRSYFTGRQHSAPAARTAKRLRVRAIGKRQERRERCTGYACKRAD